MKKLVLIFDLDGTLWDSSSQVLDSWNITLEKCPDIDYLLTLEDMQSYMGKTMKDISLLAFPHVTPERAMEIMELCCEAENAHLLKVGGNLFEGLESTLAALRAQHELYIVSNCQKGYIEVFLQHHNLEYLFCGFDCYGNTLAPKGATIKGLLARYEIENAIYIGDTASDFTAAKAAGLPFVHCTYGFGEAPEADYAISKIADLPALIAEIEI